MVHLRVYPWNCKTFLWNKCWNNWSHLCWCRNSYVSGLIYNKRLCGIEIDFETQNSTSPFLPLLCFRQGHFWCTPWAGRKLVCFLELLPWNFSVLPQLPFLLLNVMSVMKWEVQKAGDWQSLKQVVFMIKAWFSLWHAIYQQSVTCLESDMQLLLIFET